MHKNEVNPYKFVYTWRCLVRNADILEKARIWGDGTRAGNSQQSKEQQMTRHLYLYYCLSVSPGLSKQNSLVLEFNGLWEELCGR